MDAVETKNVVIDPRVEIDTSPPFESVKEAVVRFGGSGPWIPHHLLRLAPPPPKENEEILDLNKMEETAIKYERDLMMKEKEALNVLKEVEAAKRFVEGLKVNLMEEVSAEFVSEKQMQKLTKFQSPGYVLMELDQAKMDLNKMSMDLSVIRTSVESLNKKVKEERVLLQKSGEQKSLRYDNDGSRMKMHEVNDISLEAEQFKKMAEASRYEVMKAMSEIERTKASIKIAEMRLVAAKKMEEAAKAVEAIAFAEKKAQFNSQNSSVTPQGITLPYEEYYALAQKAQQAEESCKIDNFNHNANKVQKNKNTDNEDEGYYIDRTTKNVPVFRSSVSIGDILSRKLIVQDDIVVKRQNNSEGHRVSFSQMLREQSGIILNNAAKSGNKDNGTVHNIAQRKKFGFFQVPIHKHNKKKTQPLNQLR